MDTVRDDKKFAPNSSEEMHIFDDIMTWKDSSPYKVTKVGTRLQLVIMKDPSKLTMVLSPAELCRSHSSRDDYYYKGDSLRRNLLTNIADFMSDPAKRELKIGGGFTPDEKVTLCNYMDDVQKGSERRFDDLGSDICKKVFRNKEVELVFEKPQGQKIREEWLYVVSKQEIKDRSVMMVYASDIS